LKGKKKKRHGPFMERERLKNYKKGEKGGCFCFRKGGGVVHLVEGKKREALIH